MRYALLLALALFGCDFSLSDPGCASAPPFASRVDRFEVSGVAERDGVLVEADTLRGSFSFLARGVLRSVGGRTDCPSVRPVGDLPTSVQVSLDAPVIAGGAHVPAGIDLTPLLRFGDAQKLFRYGPTGPGLGPVVAFDSSRVEIPEGRRLLTLRWFAGEVEFESELVVLYLHT